MYSTFSMPTMFATRGAVCDVKYTRVACIHRGALIWFKCPADHAVKEGGALHTNEPDVLQVYTRGLDLDVVQLTHKDIGQNHFVKANTAPRHCWTHTHAIVVGPQQIMVEVGV